VRPAPARSGTLSIPTSSTARRRARRALAAAVLAAAVSVGVLPTATAADAPAPLPTVETSPAETTVATDVAPTEATADAAAAPAGQTTAGTSGGRLTWAPPELTTPTTVAVSPSNRNLRLNAAQDYVIDMPDEPLAGFEGLTIAGGRNVVLIGGQIDISEGALAAGGGAPRGLYLTGQTGTVHVEGLRISGAGLGEGINLDERRGAIVQLQNIRVDTVQGSYATNHADVLQTWAGPRQLLVDGLTGYTQYQGMFMLPTQHFDGPQPERFDLRRVDLRGGAASAYMMWRDGLAWPLTVSDTWISPRKPNDRNSFLWPKGTGSGTQAWPSVKVGTPPGGEFVPAGTAGPSYVSPGYQSSGGGAVPGPDQSADAGSGPRFVPVTPARIHDARGGVRAGTVTCVQVAGKGGVPVGATGAALNVTSVAAAGPGNVVVYPDPGSTWPGQAPTTSTVNFVPGADVANAALVALPASGRVCYLLTGAPSGILIDVTGYTRASSGIELRTPSRVEDRSNVRPGATVTVQVAGRGVVPVGATSVLLNVTAAASRSTGNIQVYAQGAPRPSTSTLNLPRSGDRANAAIVQLSAAGALSYRVDTAASNKVRVVLDVVGYTMGGSAYVPVTPVRLLDTRSTATLAGGRGLQVALGASAGVPADASAVVLNTVAVAPSTGGNLQVFPFRKGSSQRPGASTLNYQPGEDVANMVVAGIGDDRKVTLFTDQPAKGTTHVVVDVVGYIAG
jgi:hypothetical protein